MATLLPPPKRQKSAYSQSLKPRVTTPEPTPVPSVVVQFRSAEDGSNLGPAINLPADTSRDALQMLVNKLRGEVSKFPAVRREVEEGLRVDGACS
jgi:ribosome assembly protein 4